MHESGPIDIVTRPGDRPPRLPGKVVVRDATLDAVDALAADLFLIATGAARAHSEVHIAIAVSDAIVPLLRTLMIDPGLRAFPWERTHVWLVDEFWHDDSEHPDHAPETRASRAPLLHEWLVEPSGIPASHVHVFPADDPPTAYADQIRASLIWREKGSERMDILLLAPDATGPDFLALAPDLHDANGSIALARWVGERRVAMTRAMARRSEFIAVLATGASARDVVSAWSSRRVPFPAIPLAGELRWYLDRDACPS